MFEIWAAARPEVEVVGDARILDHCPAGTVAHPLRNNRDVAQVVRVARIAHSGLGGTRNARSPGMAIMPFPHRYSVALSDDRLTAEPRQPIAVGAPPQFGGTNNLLRSVERACIISRAIDAPVEIVASVRGRT